MFRSCMNCSANFVPGNPWETMCSENCADIYNNTYHDESEMKQEWEKELEKSSTFIVKDGNEDWLTRNDKIVEADNRKKKIVSRKHSHVTEYLSIEHLLRSIT